MNFYNYSVTIEGYFCHNLGRLEVVGGGGRGRGSGKGRERGRGRVCDQTRRRLRKLVRVGSDFSSSSEKEFVLPEARRRRHQQRQQRILTMSEFIRIM